MKQLEVRLELVGENTCARWHRDQFVGRAIVTYTGAAGTEYTSRDNVDFKELMCCGTRLGRREPHTRVPAVAHPISPPSPYRCCGKSEHCIYDQSQTEQAAPGDLLLMKGTKYHGTRLGRSSRHRAYASCSRRASLHYRYPRVSKHVDGGSGLVHKSPPKQHDGKGNVVNRLILKVDVHDLSDGECSPSLALLREKGATKAYMVQG